jgi:hypothetical protein
MTPCPTRSLDLVVAFAGSRPALLPLLSSILCLVALIGPRGTRPGPPPFPPLPRPTSGSLGALSCSFPFVPALVLSRWSVSLPSRAVLHRCIASARLTPCVQENVSQGTVVQRRCVRVEHGRRHQHEVHSLALLAPPLPSLDSISRQTSGLLVAFPCSQSALPPLCFENSEPETQKFEVLFFGRAGPSLGPPERCCTPASPA